jgi:nucleoside-diphosphate-sugar epimerase
MGGMLVKVFVTGASGFIGAHVTRALLARGHSVMALAMPGDPLWRLQNETHQFALATGLLNDTDTLRPALADFRPEACIHLAWYAEPGAYLHSPENLNSLTASLALLHELIGVDCRHVVMAGTCAEYDTDFGFLREDTPTHPVTLYAAAKLACCLLSGQMAARAKIKLAWARIFYPYGAQEDERRVLPAAIRSLLQGRPFQATTGEQVRDYIHVKDVAEAFCALLEKRGEGIFNIASGVPITIRQLLQTVGRLMGSEELIEFDATSCREWEPPFICGDNHKLKALGWQPGCTIEQGLSETIEWWKAHEREQRHDHPH